MVPETPPTELDLDALSEAALAGLAYGLQPEQKPSFANFITNRIHDIGVLFADHERWAAVEKFSGEISPAQRAELAAALRTLQQRAAELEKLLDR
jgi:hypothetical protein